MAAECTGNPGALGTSRTIVVDPAEHARIGTMQYGVSLPLADKEVVLTFDDGPLPPYTNRVLETLASECVKATFFIVGKMARAYPDGVRRVYNQGHTVATHSHSHPRIFTKLSYSTAVSEIDNGIADTEAALGDPRALAPFFRFPGLGRTAQSEEYLASRGLMTWSADFPADDWMRISAEQVIARAMDRLEGKGRGVMLLHDIQPVTALALPEILRQLKSRGYRIVHVVPSTLDRPKTVTEPSAWVYNTKPPSMWPVVLPTKSAVEAELPVPSASSFGFPETFAAKITIPALDSAGPAAVVERASVTAASAGRGRAARKTVWPVIADASAATPPGPLLPVHSAQFAVTYARLAAPSAAEPAVTREIVTAAAESRRALTPRAEMKPVVERVAARPARTAEAKPKLDSDSQSGWARMLNWFQ